jgi:chemotaxis protein histidine kinase CheA
MADDGGSRANAERQLRDEVASLAEKFLRRTRDQAGSLSELSSRLSTGDAAALEQIQHLTHKIHGSGAIFGFADISEAAGELERLCDGLQAAGTSAPPADVVQRMLVGIERLTRAVTAAEEAAAVKG